MSLRTLDQNFRYLSGSWDPPGRRHASGRTQKRRNMAEKRVVGNSSVGRQQSSRFPIAFGFGLAYRSDMAVSSADWMGHMDNTNDVPTTVDATAPTTTTTPAKRATTKPRATRPAVVALPRRVATFADLVTVGRHVTALTGTVDAILTTAENIVRRYHVDVPVAARHRSCIDGRRIMDTQNDIVKLSPPVSDVAFTVMHRIAFPAASGQFTSAPFSTGVKIASGVRAEWTRWGHGDPSWRAGMTAPVAAPGPDAPAVRMAETRRAAMDAGVRTNGNA